MNDECTGVDESAPVIYPFKIKTGLYTFVMDITQVVLEISTVFPDGIKEEHTCIES